MGTYPFQPGQPAQLAHAPIDGTGSEGGSWLLAQEKMFMHGKGLEVDLRGGQRGRGEPVDLPFVNLAPVEGPALRKLL